MIDLDDVKLRVERDGFAVTAPVLSRSEVAQLNRCIARSRGDGRGNLRDLFRRVPDTARLPRHAQIRQVVEAVLGPGPFGVRALLLDKTPIANWNVAWHQDVTIAVKRRSDAPGYGSWSIKEDVPHVQPPTPVLEAMLAVRLHLDHCGPENGPLRLIPGSHQHGRMSPEEVDRFRASHAAVECHVARGGLLLMRPLTLHASSAARAPAQRRVVHLEFAAIALDPGVEWYEQLYTCVP